MPEPSFTARPLFDTHRVFIKLPMGLGMLEQYPASLQFLSKLIEAMPGVKDDFIGAQRFLKSYSRKSEKTFTSFRNEVERFLLWSWTVAERPVSNLKRSDIENYFDFLHSPPLHWIGTATVKRFIYDNNLDRHDINPDWRPFVSRESSADEKKAYKPSHSGSALAYSAISVFYDHMVQEDMILGNPIPGIRKASPYLIKDAQMKQVKRLSALQWDYVLETTCAAAVEQPELERTIFIIACLKSLYLRISELSDRSQWTPVWEHVWRDHEGNWWFKAFGKGRKIRDISISEAMWTYIQRYRQYRNMPEPPAPGDKEPLLNSRNGGGLTSRQISRLVQDAFDIAYAKMVSDGFKNDAKELRHATTHWLRHTGASQDIATRPLKHMADDLGHASMGTTDRVYIQSDMKERAATGKNRQV
ncbi:MAG: recombinase XerC [unclassified Hahellaceae]|nr:recombinase XerC [Hahellaceae bacterium]|tara:strand:- start:12275 stop:13522 length:1248 start_codon:yes stop_codon:yes gene_type:complete